MATTSSDGRAVVPQTRDDFSDLLLLLLALFWSYAILTSSHFDAKRADKYVVLYEMWHRSSEQAETYWKEHFDTRKNSITISKSLETGFFAKNCIIGANDKASIYKMALQVDYQPWACILPMGSICYAAIFHLLLPFSTARFYGLVMTRIGSADEVRSIETYLRRLYDRREQILNLFESHLQGYVVAIWFFFASLLPPTFVAIVIGMLLGKYQSVMSPRFACFLPFFMVMNLAIIGFVPMLFRNCINTCCASVGLDPGKTYLDGVTHLIVMLGITVFVYKDSWPMVVASVLLCLINTFSSKGWFNNRRLRIYQFVASKQYLCRTLTATGIGLTILFFVIAVIWVFYHPGYLRIW